MKTKQILLTLSMALALTACGGGDSTPGPTPDPTPDYTLTAIDGYLSKAKVYVDKNSNGVADADELVGETDENGQIELAPEDFDYDVIVRVVAGRTEDSDYAGTAPTQYEMIAEAGSYYVTPYTTYAYLSNKDVNSLIAELDTDGSLGLTEEMLTGDYIAIKQAGGVNADGATAAHILARSMVIELSEKIKENYDDNNFNSVTKLERQVVVLSELVDQQVAATSSVSDISDMVIALETDASGNLVSVIITDTDSINDTNDDGNPNQSKYAINDTGITRCDNFTTCDENSTAGQDAHYGRDANALLNDDSNGYKGFNFTKIAANGEALPADAADWACVQDNITGLMWEVKEPDDGDNDTSNNTLRAADNTYDWYNPNSDTNGGHAGSEGGNTCSGLDDNNKCNTEAFVAAVNLPTEGICGHTDWRLPTREELRSIVHYGNYSPAIDDNYFPNTQSDWYWSASPYAHYGYGDAAWSFNFDYGYDYTFLKSYDRPVRLVRAGQ